MDRQEYRIDEQRCRNGRRVVLSGGSLLAGQWAVYDLLQRLGVRYFHPEQTLYPGPADTAAHVNWPAEPLQVRARPASPAGRCTCTAITRSSCRRRSDADRAQMAALQRRWIDWNVKLRQTQIDGWDEEFVGNYAYVRGFPRTASLNLANAQQGGRPLLNADDPRTEKLQIGRAIDQALRPVPGLPPVESLSFQFNPSEFSETDEDLTVERLNTMASHIERHHPGVSLYTINHGTAQPPTAKRQVRFFDLSAFAPPRLGVMVHPLMFYDLERPAAGVYGNDDFGPLLAFIRAQQAVRPIVHYPEASWWLTFDLPVPLYLAPVTLEARQHDLQLLAPYRTAEPGARHGVMGHHLFTSGQEWGYWLIDYCVAQMVWDPALGHRGCVDDFTRQLARGTEIAAVLAEVEARQVRDLRDPERLRFLVGSDDETEAAAGLGIRFHPLPPPPADLLEWDEAAVSALRERSLRPLAAMAADYHTWANRVEGLLPLQSAAQAPWVREIRDGLRIFALRAEHAVAVYEGALVVREQRVAAAAAGCGWCWWRGQHDARSDQARAGAGPGAGADRCRPAGGAAARDRLPLPGGADHRRRPARYARRPAQPDGVSLSLPRPHPSPGLLDPARRAAGRSGPPGAARQRSIAGQRGQAGAVSQGVGPGDGAQPGAAAGGPAARPDRDPGRRRRAFHGAGARRGRGRHRLAHPARGPALGPVGPAAGPAQAGRPGDPPGPGRGGRGRAPGPRPRA